MAPPDEDELEEELLEELVELLDVELLDEELEPSSVTGVLLPDPQAASTITSAALSAQTPRPQKMFFALAAVVITQVSRKNGSQTYRRKAGKRFTIFCWKPSKVNAFTRLSGEIETYSRKQISEIGP